MSMFCYQCQETARNTACTTRGVCGKSDTISNLQDLLIHILQGIALYAEEMDGTPDRKYGLFVCKALFSTITNANFDDERITLLIEEALSLRNELRQETGGGRSGLPEAALWEQETGAKLAPQADEIGIPSYDTDEDARSLKSLLLYGMKGISAYTDHAAVLGYHDDEIYAFLVKGLAAISRELPVDELQALALEAGRIAVSAMALLDKANTETYGHPEITKVDIGVRGNPAILVSGHDLRDMQNLLEQTAGTGIDVYTHGEMLPAHYYPAFKKYGHFAGNYGGSWWKQGKEFESFNGPILMTTNCITPVKDSYRDRIFTTGMAGYPGVAHIPDGADGQPKDFSKIIEKARGCSPPEEIETGEITGGFAHNQVLALADKVVDAVKSGAIKRFVVMAGCDGRQPGRSYFTEVAENLPGDAIILTAGCAKYRYNKLELGDIGGIPRVLDAGQCNDSYSLALIALELKKAFDLDDLNDLPISFDIAWYEQKAVAVLLALLHLGFKGIRLGPSLPAFLSPNVAKVLVESFDIKLIGDVEGDIAEMMAGR